MKSAFAAVLILVSFICFSQSDPLSYSDVVYVSDSASAEELYSRARMWFSEAFNDADRVLDLEDRSSGQLAASPLIDYNPGVFAGIARTEGVIDYKLKVMVKDGRYKYEITEFFHNPYDRNGWSFKLLTIDESPYVKINLQPKGWHQKVWDDLKSQSDQTAQVLISSLKKSMETKTALASDDW